MAYNKETFKYQQIQDAISGVAGAASTGVMGAAIGGVGLGIGAGIASATGAIGDLAINGKQFSLSQNYQREQFNLQLGNIQNLSNTISKITAYNINSKY